MRIGIISDIHGNFEALEAVLADIDRQGVDGIISLGDIIGYGPDPVACVDLVAKRCKWSLMGNHDFGVLYEPTNFNAAAEAAAYWTRAQFEEEAKRDRKEATKRWEFLGKLRVRVAMGPFLCVHGSPRRPINEYMFPEDAENSPNKMTQIFERIDKFCFVGHTHVPGVFTGDNEFYRPAELNNVYEFNDEEKAIINPGSVGQPRDLDPRAAYAIVEMKDDTKAERVHFYRLEYPIQPVVDKIHAIPQLTNWLGDRLLEGR
ncbi:MAG: metallophosphatase family protein [Planctomycetes bacterium]|nr:metallophosphatase family protein [Planctomycetota bacterium]